MVDGGKERPKSGNKLRTEQVAMSLYFAHGAQTGFPNGLPTWDEMKEGDRIYWRALAVAASEAVFACYQRDLTTDSRG